MGARRANIPLLIGLIASIAMHAFALLPMLVEAMSGPPGPRIALARFNPEDVMPPEPDDDQPTVLGLEEGSPSTLTWVGYDVYEKHLAHLAEIEQAAFEDEPTGDEGESPPSPAADAEAIEGSDASPAAAADAASSAPPVTTVDDPVTATTTIEPDVETGAEIAGSVLDAEAQQEMADILASLIQPFGISLLAPATKQADAPVDPAQVREPADGRDEPAANPAPTEQPATAAGISAADPRPQEKPPRTPNQGEKADKESDATSLVEVALNDIQIGKPLAARGLELRPRRPRFTTLQRLTASAVNPIVEIRFGADGVPRKAIVHRGTGNSGMDAAIRASLYRWRAAGEPLKQLGEGETSDITMRIILFGRGGA